ncbi:MAG: hypothetical protein J3K34DRAFT_521044 [Monoraphidium minutum]|nr:MAG: hypothetical protein J3K34DRAFT_521044 [Monoraphidium minutum]
MMQARAVPMLALGAVMLWLSVLGAEGAAGSLVDGYHVIQQTRVNGAGASAAADAAALLSRPWTMPAARAESEAAARPRGALVAERGAAAPAPAEGPPDVRFQIEQRALGAGPPAAAARDALRPTALAAFAPPEPRARRMLTQAAGGPSPASSGLSLLEQLLQLPFLALGQIAAGGGGAAGALAPRSSGGGGPFVYQPPPAAAAARLPKFGAPPPAAPPADAARRPPRRARAGPPPVELRLTVSFVSTGAFGGMLRLPPEPRALQVLVLAEPGGEAVDARGGLPYAEEQVVALALPAGGRYTLEIRDDGADSILLFASELGAIDAPPGAGPLDLTAAVQLQPVELQARFTRLAWSGGRYMAPDEAADANIAVIGAKLTVWTRSSATPGGARWFTRYTDEQGLGLFFLPTRSDEFFANFTLGDALLATRRLAPLEWQGYLPAAPSLQPPAQQVDADRKLLCTGEVEEVRAARGDSGGSFPPANMAGAYTPLNFACRWAITPPVAGSLVTLDVDFSTLLPGEAVILYLDPSSTAVLTPGCCGGKGTFRAAVLAETSIPIEFRTGDRPDRRGAGGAVGGFRIDWNAEERGGGRASFDPQEMMIIVICVAASALLALALCAYCARRYRHRRGAAALAGAPGARFNAHGAHGAGAARHCPSPVRRLLPSKPYLPPAANPLPGAGGAEPERDCCSICLVEFEAQEAVTVLPCRHFYHGECIDGWLKRNCTCPLCKADVLAAVEALAAPSAAATPQPLAPAALGASPRGGAAPLSPAGPSSAGPLRLGLMGLMGLAVAPAPPSPGPAAPSGLEQEEDTGVTVSVVVGAARGAGAGTCPSPRPPSRALSRRGSGAAAGALPSPGGAPAEPAGRADASTSDFFAAARAAAALSVAAGGEGGGGAEDGGGGGETIELQPMLQLPQSISQRLLGALRAGAAAAGAGPGPAAAPAATGAPRPATPAEAVTPGGGGAGGRLPGSVLSSSSADSSPPASPLPAAPAFPPRVVRVYAYAGAGDDAAEAAPAVAASGGAQAEGPAAAGEPPASPGAGAR